MRRRDRLAVVAAVAVVVALFGGCSSDADPDSSPAAETAAPGPETRVPGSDGQDLYQVRCSGCHGPSGEGNLGPPLVGIADRLTAGQMIEVVTAGRGTMPTFASALSGDEIASVVDYIGTHLSPGGGDAPPAT